MKKKILFSVLAVAMLSFVACNRDNYVCDYPNVVVTGRLGFMAQSCPIPQPDSEYVYLCWLQYLVLRNDAGTFVLRKDGLVLYRSHYPSCFGELGNFSEGDRISICGSFHKFNSEGFWVAEEHYVLDISQIIR